MKPIIYEGKENNKGIAPVNERARRLSDVSGVYIYWPRPGRAKYESTFRKSVTIRVRAVYSLTARDFEKYNLARPF